MSLTNIRGQYGISDYLAGTAAGREDHHRPPTPTAAAVGHRSGLRLLCVDTGGWICIAYADDDPVDCATVALQRVTGGISLEESPHHPHVLARRVQLRVCRRVVQDQAMGGGV
jgi:hypothetical protein